jgi:prevent-host-death family protein
LTDLASTLPMMTARKHLGELLDRCALRDELFVLERRGRAVAVIVSAQRLERLERAARELAELRATAAAAPPARHR